MKPTEDADKFLQKIQQEYGCDRISQIEHLINFDREKEILQRLLLLQWWLLGKDVIEYDVSTIADLVSDLNNPDCLVHKFESSIKSYSYTDKFNIISNGKIKGHTSLRDFPRKWAENEVILIKKGKNYHLTELGKICGNYIFYKLLIAEISKKDLINFIRLEGNLQSQIYDHHDNADLIRMQIIQDTKTDSNKYDYTPKFSELITFLQNFPELYPNELLMIKKSLINKIFHRYAANLNINHTHLLQNGEKITNSSIKREKINWIYNLELRSKENQTFDLPITNRVKIKANPFKVRFQVLKSPGGYGKTIFLYQLALNNLLEIHNTNSAITEISKKKQSWIPIIIVCRNLHLLKSKDKYTLFYNAEKIVDFRTFFKINTPPKFEELIVTLLYSFLKKSSFTTKATCQFFLKSIINHNILLIFDGWDEIEDNLMKKCIMSLIEELFMKMTNIVCLVATRYLDQILEQKLELKRNKSIKKKYDPVHLSLSSLTDSQISNYLSDFFQTDQQTINKFIQETNSQYTPLELYFLTLFPKIDLPKYKFKLYERRILFGVLSEFYPIAKLQKIDSITEIFYLLDKNVQQSDSDNFLLNNNQDKTRNKDSILKNDISTNDHGIKIRDLIYGRLFSLITSSSRNYSLYSIMPYICYSSLFPLKFPPLEYAQCIRVNPVLKRFIAPKDEPTNNSLIAILLDWHFMDYFLSYRIFQAFCNDETIQPIPYKSVENFLKERFENLDESKDLIFQKFHQYGIQNFDDFLSMIYLEAKIEFPPQKFLRDDFDPGDGGFSDPGMKITMSLNMPIYGKELIEAFRFEFNKARKKKEYHLVPPILQLFNIFYKERPSIQRQIKMPTDSDPEFYDPEENHSPLDYFDIVSSLFFKDQYSPENIEIIRYEEKENEYYLQSTGFYNESSLSLEKHEGKFWKRSDIREILEKMLLISNEHLIPWLEQVYLKLPDELKPKLDSNQLKNILYSSKNQVIQRSSFNLLLRINIEQILENYQDFIQLNNKEIIDDFLEYYLPLISDKKVSNRDFSGFLRILDSSVVDNAGKTILYNHFIQVGLDNKQREAMFSRFKRNYYKKPENWDELIILQILLLINLEEEELNDDLYNSPSYYLIKDRLNKFILHAIQKKYGFYFDFLTSLEISTDLIISKISAYSFNLVEKLQILLYKPELSFEYQMENLKREIAVHIRPRRYKECDTRSGLDLIKQIQQKIQDSKSNFYSKERFLEELEELNEKLLFLDDIDRFYVSDLMECYLEWKLSLYPPNHKDYLSIAVLIFDFFKKLKIQSEQAEYKSLWNKSRSKEYTYNRIFKIINEHFYLIAMDTRIQWIRFYIAQNFEFNTYQILLYNIDKNLVENLHSIIWEKVKQNRDFENLNFNYLRKRSVYLHSSYPFSNSNQEEDQKTNEILQTLPFSLEGLLPFKEFNKIILEILHYEENMEFFDSNPFDPDDSYKIHPFLTIINNYFSLLAQYRRVEEYIEIFELYWKKYAFHSSMKNQRHITYYIIYAFSEEIMHKIYPCLNPSPYKIAFLLCYKQKSKYRTELPYLEKDSFYKKQDINIYKEISQFSKEIIYDSIQEFHKTGKNAFLYNELFLFTDLKHHSMQDIWNFIDQQLTGHKFGYYSESPHYYLIDYVTVGQLKPELLKRWNIFQHLARIQKKNRLSLSESIFRENLSEYSKLIEFIEDFAHYQFSEPYIPVLDSEKIMNFNEIQQQIKQNLDHKKQEIGYIKLDPESTFFHYFKESEYNILKQLESEITSRDGKKLYDPYADDNDDNETTEHDQIYGVNRQKDEKYQIWRALTEKERNKVKMAREKVFENEKEFCNMFYRELNEKQRKIFFSHHSTVLEWSPTPIMFFPTLKWILKQMVDNPIYQKFDIEYMMEAQAHFKNSANELKILDEILNYGFKYNKLKEWYKRLISSKELEQEIFFIFEKYITKYIYSFNELDLFPKNLRKLCITQLLSRFSLQIARKLYENNKYK
ncbi:hypothetical protein DSAG12_02646 [Promethearchaeum syntrophicum]|uniref:NACHT domain-containing protein n=1 Tax=Promethearchaeum syntrophicum TaxID=2594042 RepID=A0A5B9DDM2_9ARCH|nr:hypothetical protein [Candidatus Prometheoarchaeum syntrophicum]QEE16816.1 hypothetical protein DSAG12_02646 [Candidatus Prometheoarchaeum syntrophicum]